MPSRRRSGEDWAAQTIAQVLSNLSLTGFTQPITTRGYTGHEMVDDMGIIHMNGRIYDARIGRFLQADPFIQAATNTQSFNRYSYVLNNPLNATDPSGYFLKKLWNEIRPFVGAIVAIVLTVVAPWGSGFWATVVYGAIAGGAGAAANGGNILKGALTGAVSAAAFYGAGSAFQGAESSGNFFGSGLNGTAYAAKVFSHAMVGGVMSVLQGGKFGHGFAAAGVTQAFAGKIDSIGGKGSAGYFSAGSRAARIVAAAVVGGTTSSITGGKFANGAITGAFSRAFNDEAHSRQTAQQKGQLTHDYEFETEICSRSSSSCTAENVWEVVKNNSVPFQDGGVTDGTVSKIPGIGTVITRVDDANYSLVNQTQDDL